MRHKGHGSINNLDEHSKGMEREDRALSIQTASHGTGHKEPRNTGQSNGCREEGDPIPGVPLGNSIIISSSHQTVENPRGKNPLIIIKGNKKRTP